MIDPIKVGNFIKQLRTNKGFSQNDLALKLNVSREAISKWENGHHLPDIGLLDSLSEILGVTKDEILNGDYQSVQKKKVNLKYLLFIPILLLLVFFLNKDYYLSFDSSKQLFSTESVYESTQTIEKGTIYLLKWDCQTTQFNQLNVSRFEIENQSILIFNLSSKGYQILFNQFNNDNFAVIDYVDWSEQRDYSYVIYYPGNLDNLKNINQIQKLISYVESQNGSILIQP